MSRPILERLGFNPVGDVHILLLRLRALASTDRPKCSPA